MDPGAVEESLFVVNYLIFPSEISSRGLLLEALRDIFFMKKKLL